MKTRTVFKVFDDGDVIAFFPDLVNFGYIGSYEIVGQHGDAHPELINELNCATKKQRSKLIKELTSLGYDIDDRTDIEHQWCRDCESFEEK